MIRRDWMMTGAGALLALMGGSGMALSVYRWDTPLLTLIAWVPVVLAQHMVLPRRVAYLGPALGWFSYLGLAIVPALAPELGGYIWLLPLGIALISALLERGALTEQQGTGYRTFWWTSAATFTAVEYGRTFIPAQGTWSLAGYGLTPADGWRWAAGLIGLLGLCFVVWATNFAIAQLILGVTRRAPRTTWAYRSAWLMLLPAFALTAWPALPGAVAPRSLKVAAIQVGFDLDHEPWRSRTGDEEALTHELFQIGADETRRAAAAGARLVVWPEGFLRQDPIAVGGLRSALESLARQTQAAIVTGYVVQSPDGRRNEAALVTADGKWHITAKDHPVPWAEAETAAGTQVALADVDGVTIGVMICYDADFTDTFRDRVRAGADLVVAPAHDWLAIGGPRLRHVQLRAAENRTPIVMADWSVGSAAVDAAGRVIAQAPTNRLAAMQVITDVPVGAAPAAPYTSTGDWVGWGTIGLAVAGMVMTNRARIHGARMPLAA